MISFKSVASSEVSVSRTASPRCLPFKPSFGCSKRRTVLGNRDPKSFDGPRAGCQTEPCTRDLGVPLWRPFSIVVSSLGHPSLPIFGLKGRRHLSSRNNFNWQRPETARIATLSQQSFFRLDGKWGLAKLYGGPQRPPPWCVRGAGDVERSHGLKLNYNTYTLYMVASRTVGLTGWRANRSNA
jgi:hypothetical protein